MHISSLLRAVDWSPALVTALRQGYSRKAFVRDLFAGLTVGVVALPLAMAFAIASGVPPERGLFTAIVAGFIISALGGSRHQIGGPTGAFVVIVAGVVGRYGYEGLVAATLLAGVMLVIMGVLRIGRFLKFIPYPVVTGFTAGIALIIFTTQVKDFLGLPLESAPAEFLPKVKLLAAALPNLDPITTAVGFGTLFTLVAVRRYTPRIPAPIVGIALATLAVWLLGLDVETIGTRFGGVPSGLPTFSLPTGPFPELRLLIPEAVTIAFLAGIESLLSAVVADGMTRERHNSSTELMAQGLANIASSLFGGIPATGAIARTATNIRAGAFSPVAGIVHALTLALFMLALAPLASAIPLASLSAVLMVVAWDMSERHRFKRLLRAPKSDAVVLLLTFGLTVLVDLTVAVEVGVVLSALLFMRRMSELTDIQALSANHVAGELVEGDACGLDTRDSPVVIYEIDGPFFFGVAQRFTDIMHYTRKPPKVVVLRMRQAPSIDATAVSALEQVLLRLKAQGTAVVLTGVNERVVRVLGRMGVLDQIDPENVFREFGQARQRIEELVTSSGGVDEKTE